MTRAAVAGLVVLLVGAALAGVLVARGAGSTPERVAVPPAASLAPDARTPEDLARAACVQLRLAAQGIQAGRSARRVRTSLAFARVLAAEAVRRDGRWSAVSGGVAALDESLRRDDAAAADVGLPAALQQCDEVREG